MTPTSEQRHATFVLRTLLDDVVGPESTALDWPLLERLAERNAVLVRLADRLERGGVQLPPAFAAARAAARARAEVALDVIAAVSAACARHGIAFLFPTALDHYPDLGQDLDLLVLSQSEASDAAALGALVATRRDGGLRDRLAGATTYRLEPSGLLVDIHHGRLGIIGEQTWYPATLIANRRPRTIGTRDCFVPSVEDQMVLQGMRRVYGRRSFRLTDVVATVTALRVPGLDWGYVIRTARALGMLPGLSCYLSYVDQIHRALYGRDLIPEAPRGRLTLGGWGRVAFRGAAYRFPAARVGGRLYWQELGTALATRNWSAASRLGLLPAVLVVEQVRRLTRPHGGSPAPTPTPPAPQRPRWA
jgi:hypothetical protein